MYAMLILLIVQFWLFRWGAAFEGIATLSFSVISVWIVGSRIFFSAFSLLRFIELFDIMLCLVLGY